MTHGTQPELDAFIEDWQETPEQIKATFLYFKEHLAGKDERDDRGCEWRANRLPLDTGKGDGGFCQY